MSKTKAILATIIITLGICFFFGLPAETAEIRFAWDPNPKEDLVVGYRIYFGTVSRPISEVRDAVIKDWCAEHEPKNDKCTKEWGEYFAKFESNDACHAMLYDYDKSVDVGNVTRFV